MAVGEAIQGQIYPVAGVRLAAVASHIRYANRLDLVLVELAENSVTAGVFTQNRFCAPPVYLARAHLKEASPRYFVINTGNANAGTGASGMSAARECCAALAQKAGVAPSAVLPFSTGVIGEPLPVTKVVEGIHAAFGGFGGDNWALAARGIMTTDTRPKLISEQLTIDGKQVTLTGFAKGAGMIKPNMATMLGYVFTDARIAPALLQAMLDKVVNRSFNRITVDGDTSTNDSCMLTATGCGELTLTSMDSPAAIEFISALDRVFRTLATEIIRDAEGATKFITIEVNSGGSSAECLRVGYAIAESPLVKTAFFASDPNWGRILAAIGRAGIDDLAIESVAVFLGEHQIVANGSRDPAYTEAQGKATMTQDEITVRVELARGNCSETVWTSDLSHDYVRINAEYRS